MTKLDHNMNVIGRLINETCYMDLYGFIQISCKNVSGLKKLKTDNEIRNHAGRT